MPRCIMLIGPPGCGKSSYAEAYFSHCCIVNLDTLGTRAKEKHFVETAAMWGQDIIVDNTNIDKKTRARFFGLLKSYGYRFHAIVFDITLEENINRCHGRKTKRFPAHILKAYRNRLEMPTKEEGFRMISVIKG